MPKYLVIWEGDASRWPDDAKERVALSTKFNEMTKQDMKEGKIVDWGVFVEGNSGYAVIEGNGSELYKEVQRYRPYMNFKVHQVLSIDEHLEALKSLME